MQRQWNITIPVFFLLLLLPAASWAAPASSYPMTGTVLETKSGPGHVHLYKVETDSSIYKLLCAHHGLLNSAADLCEVNGKPLAQGDLVHLRSDGRTVFLDSGKGQEEALVVLLQETKILPSLETATRTGGEAAVVLALGREEGSQTVALPTHTDPPTPDAPKGSDSMQVQVWGEILYVQTESYIYRLACSGRKCSAAGQVLSPGDLLMVRVAGKWAYLSIAPANTQNAGTKESKFQILSVSGVDEAPSLQPL